MQAVKSVRESRGTTLTGQKGGRGEGNRTVEDIQSQDGGGGGECHERRHAKRTEEEHGGNVCDM